VNEAARIGRKAPANAACIDLDQGGAGTAAPFCGMFVQSDGIFDPTHCPACRRPMVRVRMIRRTFQDDMEVWECRECGTSIAQTVNVAKLARHQPGSIHVH
jgi:hypothetical protein